MLGRTGSALAPVSSGGYKPGRADPTAIVLAIVVQAGLVAGLIGLGPPVPRIDTRPPLVVRSFALEQPPTPEPEQKTLPQPSSSPPAIYVPRAVVPPAPTPPTIATAPDPAVVQPEPSIVIPPAPGLPTPPARPVATGDLSSTMVHAPPPRYPRESRRRREQGTVLLAVLLSTKGTVVDIRVARTSGHPRLDAAARDAVRAWQWSPTIVDGVPAQVSGTVEIPFVLTG